MFRISRFQHLMQGLPRGTFRAIVARHAGDRHSKGFGCWDLLLAQVFGQLGGSRSLRELETGFNAQPAQHYHLGTAPLRRSTLADAAARRTPAVFEEAARGLMAGVSRQLRRTCGQGLQLLDSTSLTLKGRGFDAWTADTRTRHTQGLKLHVLFDAACATPVHAGISAANVNDVSEAAHVPLTPGATYVFDKGYCDYGWWARIDAAGAGFVTRFKRNAGLEPVGQRAIADADREHILADELVRVRHAHPRGGRRSGYRAPLRRITVARPGHATPLVLATNDLQRPAAAIARAYRDRWQIELFFKWLKQHLRIKRFLGRSENAVRIQILCALIAYLLVALYRQACGAKTSLLRTLDELRVALHQRPESDDARERRRRERAEAERQQRLFA